MRKILIPTDFSETSMNAIVYAMELFKYEHADVLLMNAFADDVYENTQEMSQDFFEQYKEKAEDATNRLLRKAVAEVLEKFHNPKHMYNYVAKFGSLVDVVNELVDKLNVDVVVMGTKGKSNKSDVTFGSQTLQVIKYVKCPVLAVPVGFHGYSSKNILFPTDYMIPFQRRELKLASTIASRHTSKTHFLYVSNTAELSQRQKDNRMLAMCCYNDDMASYLQETGADVTETINKTIAERSIEMLVMVNHRHSYLENILYRSTIEKIGLDISIPFLVLQNLPR